MTAVNNYHQLTVFQIIINLLYILTTRNCSCRIHIIGQSVTSIASQLTLSITIIDRGICLMPGASAPNKYRKLTHKHLNYFPFSGVQLAVHVVLLALSDVIEVNPGHIYLCPVYYLNYTQRIGFVQCHLCTLLWYHKHLIQCTDLSK